ncbi:hypothetical protein DCC62_22250 [candidate division KSB1 bacterium]|nr:MAG: hypothetical protein DCC62_22250 [candidate division KSB1 bacterium]
MIATVLAIWWLLPSLLRFLGAKDESVQNLSAFVQLLIWSGAALIYLFRRRKKSARAEASPTSLPATATILQSNLTFGPQSQYVKDATVGGDVLGPGASKTVQHISLESERQQFDQAQRRYLNKLKRVCEALPLATLGGEEGAEDELRLEHVYIALDTETRVDREVPKNKKRQEQILERGQDSRPLSVLEAFEQCPRLVLLGAPGAGKSTFVRMLLAWQAGVLLNEKDEALPGCGRDLFPLLVVLRDLGITLANLSLQNLNEDQQSEALAVSVRDHILRELKRYEAEAFSNGIREALNEGRCLLVLDGLDEVAPRPA